MFTSILNILSAVKKPSSGFGDVDINAMQIAHCQQQQQYQYQYHQLQQQRDYHLFAHKLAEEQDMRINNPAVKDAWDQYQMVLRLNQIDK
jgi:ubiquinone biosynthesis protein UbiJ